MSVLSQLQHRLETRLEPESLEILDESDRHRGHSGWKEGGETHFRIAIKSSSFGGMSRIGRERAVHRAIGKDLLAKIHAISLHLSAP